MWCCSQTEQEDEHLEQVDKYLERLFYQSQNDDDAQSNGHGDSDSQTLKDAPCHRQEASTSSGHSGAWSPDDKHSGDWHGNSDSQTLKGAPWHRQEASTSSGHSQAWSPQQPPEPGSAMTLVCAYVSEPSFHVLTQELVDNLMSRARERSTIDEW